MSADVSSAVACGQAAAAAGDAALARRWLERALRLAPGNGTAALALATLQLAGHAAEAADLFAGVARQHDLLEAWLGLAAACHLQGLAARAADALANALRRHSVIAGSIAFQGDAIALAAGAAGWCALDGGGSLAVRLLRPPSTGSRPTATLDGQPLTLRPLPDGRSFAASLDGAWRQAGAATALLEGAELLGSPVAARTIARVEGFVESADGGLSGWAWCPNDPDRDPVLSVMASGVERGMTVAACDMSVKITHPRPLARPRGFCVPEERMRGLAGTVSVTGHDGRNLAGSPLYPPAGQPGAGTAAVACLFPAPGSPSGQGLPAAPPPTPDSPPARPPRGGRAKRPVDIVVPVYDSLDATLACLESVLAGLPRWARVIVVDDASPDPRVAPALGRLADSGRITLLSQPANRGFPGAANAGMRHGPARDAVILNSDTAVPPGWLARLRDAAYADPSIGTATPLSNNAEILSYPSVEHPNPVPEPDMAVQLDGLARRANAGIVVDIPTAVGFCVYIKRDCLNAAGLFREGLFAQGYGEENDFCVRAGRLGWRHVAVPGVFVLHTGGQSFGPAKHCLVERNLRRLNLLHPGYDALIREFRNRDPLAESRRRIDMQRWKAFRGNGDSVLLVLLVTHGRAGGVQRRVAERAAELRSGGLRPIILSPAATAGGGRGCVLGNGPEGGTPNLKFGVPDEIGLLASFLSSAFRILGCEA